MLHSNDAFKVKISFSNLGNFLSAARGSTGTRRRQTWRFTGRLGSVWNIFFLTLWLCPWVWKECFVDTECVFGGIERRMEHGSGRPYYVNHRTRTTQWEDPRTQGYWGAYNFLILPPPPHGTSCEWVIFSGFFVFGVAPYRMKSRYRKAGRCACRRTRKRTLSTTTRAPPRLTIQENPKTAGEYKKKFPTFFHPLHYHERVFQLYFCDFPIIFLWFSDQKARMEYRWRMSGISGGNCPSSATFASRIKWPVIWSCRWVGNRSLRSPTSRLCVSRRTICGAGFLFRSAERRDWIMGALHGSGFSCCPMRSSIPCTASLNTQIKPITDCKSTRDPMSIRIIYSISSLSGGLLQW